MSPKYREFWYATLVVDCRIHTPPAQFGRNIYYLPRNSAEFQILAQPSLPHYCVADDPASAALLGRNSFSLVGTQVLHTNFKRVSFPYHAHTHHTWFRARARRNSEFHRSPGFTHTIFLRRQMLEVEAAILKISSRLRSGAQTKKQEYFNLKVDMLEGLMWDNFVDLFVLIWNKKHDRNFMIKAHFWRLAPVELLCFSKG